VITPFFETARGFQRLHSQEAIRARTRQRGNVRNVDAAPDHHHSHPERQNSQDGNVSGEREQVSQRQQSGQRGTQDKNFGNRSCERIIRRRPVRTTCCHRLINEHPYPGS
jgi:hypothetical protein